MGNTLTTEENLHLHKMPGSSGDGGWTGYHRKVGCVFSNPHQPVLSTTQSF